MSLGSQPDPVSREALPGNPEARPLPVRPAEVQSDLEMLVSGTLPVRIGVSPRLGIQDKLNSLVESAQKAEAGARGSTLLGERTEVIANGIPSRVMVQGARDVIVPFVAITGLPAPEVATASPRTQTQLRLGVYFIETGTLQVFSPPAKNGAAARSDATAASGTGDLVSALQWMRFVEQIPRPDGWALTQSRNLFFAPETCELAKLKKHVGPFRVDAALVRQLGDIDHLVQVALERGVKLDLARINAAVLTDPAIIEATPTVQLLQHRYVQDQLDAQDRRVLGRELDARFKLAHAHVTGSALRSFSYWWNWDKACANQGSVDSTAKQLLAAAAALRDVDPSTGASFAPDFAKDLSAYIGRITPALERTRHFNEPAYLMAFQIRVAADQASSHAERLAAGYSSNPQQRYTAFLHVFKDLSGLSKALCTMARNIEGINRSVEVEQDYDEASREFRIFHAEIVELIASLNRQLRVRCPGVFQEAPSERL
ncbi:MAG: hypothetical protein J0M12_14535 [Deltaproteobacteria bacterium]|nr:hypothetical protein [Deltaproteobacteria bacterium]